MTPEAKFNRQLVKIFFATKDLREYQRAFFRVRSSFLFSECKKREKQLDALIDNTVVIDSKEIQEIQTSLF